jgi:hypothetical protein
MHNGAEGLHFSVHYSVSVPPLLLSLHPLSPRENEKVKAIGEKTSTAFRKTGTAIRERASTLRDKMKPSADQGDGETRVPDETQPTTHQSDVEKEN